MKKRTYAVSGAVALIGVILAVPFTSANAADSGSGPTKPHPAAGTQSQVIGTPVVVPPGGNGIASVTCPAGTIVTGGGGQTSAFDIFFTDSLQTGNGWTIRGSNRGTVAQNLTAVAVCLG